MGIFDSNAKSSENLERTYNKTDYIGEKKIT